MAKEPLTPFDVPADVRAMAERSLVEARKAFGQLLDAAKTSPNTAEEKGKAVQDSARECQHDRDGVGREKRRQRIRPCAKLTKLDPRTLVGVQIWISSAHRCRA